MTSDTTPPLHPPRPDAMIIATVVFAGIWLITALNSTPFVEMDSTTHFLYSRYALKEPWRLVDVWARPMCTLLYLPASQIDNLPWALFAARLTSMLQVLLMGWIAMRIARQAGFVRPELAYIVTLGQPLVFLHSLEVLTEVNFAVIAGLAFLAFQRRRWWLFAAWCALLPLSRPEGLPALLAAAGVLAWHRKLWPMLLLPVGLLAWQTTGWLLQPGGPWWRWLIDAWPYSQESMYDAKPFWQLTAVLPAVLGPLLFPAAAFGLWRCLRAPGRRLLAIVPLGVLAVHSILTATGKLASNGEPRYLLTASPFWGVCTAAGLTWLAARWRIHRLATVTGALALSIVLLHLIYPILPRKHWEPHTLVAQQVVRWHEALPEPRPMLLSANTDVWLFSAAPPSDFSRRQIESAPPGTLLLFDPVTAQFNSSIERTVSEARLIELGYVPVGLPFDLPEGWAMFRRE